MTSFESVIVPSVSLAIGASASGRAVAGDSVVMVWFYAIVDGGGEIEMDAYLISIGMVVDFSVEERFMDRRRFRLARTGALWVNRAGVASGRSKKGNLDFS